MEYKYMDFGSWAEDYGVIKYAWLQLVSSKMLIAYNSIKSKYDSLQLLASIENDE